MTRSYQLSNYIDVYNQKEADLVDLLLQLELPDVPTDVTLVKVDGAIVGIHQYILRKAHLHLMTLLKYMMKIHI